MRTCLYIITILLSIKSGYSQSIFDFESANLSLWIGDTSEFLITDGELQLNGPSTTNESHISTPNYVLDSAEWKFSFRLEANPSSANQALIYLASSSSNLESDLNGYFVKIGGTSDEVSLYRQEGDLKTEIIDGTDGILNSPTASVIVKVTRSREGIWTLFSDTSQTNAYVEEGFVQDTIVQSSQYFGLLCDYTSTRSTLFFFDDIEINGIGERDTTGPIIEQIRLTNPLTVEMSFNETIGMVSGSEFESFHDNIIVYNLDHIPNQLSQVNIMLDSVCDIFGNCSNLDTLFKYYWPQKRDIIISEFLADPTPVIGLPEAEFIELYNRSSEPIHLGDWSISDLSSSVNLPSIELNSDEYLILSSTSSYNGVQINLPSINNDHEILTLKNQIGEIIHVIEFSKDQYPNSVKSNGGWSLEMINLNLPCLQSNWTASLSDYGGTPGEENSIADLTTEDNLAPSIESVFPISNLIVELRFTEQISDSVLIPSGLTQGTSNILIDSSSWVETNPRALLLYLNDSLNMNTIYSLDATFNDCVNNPNNQTLEVGVPTKIIAGDLIINEILFNPAPGGQDFIELQNISDRILDINQIKLATMFEDGTLLSVSEIDSKNRIIHPNEIIVLCESPSKLPDEFESVEQGQLIQTNLISLPDDEGGLIIMDTNNVRIDQLYYYKGWHSLLLEDEEGTSLERIQLLNATQNESNWESTSSALRATPTQPNSQSSSNSSNSNITLSADHISPNLDGFNDNLQINYDFDQPGYSVSIWVYNEVGQNIKNLYLNELLATEGQLHWDGSNEFGEIVPTGNYILLFEVNTEDGPNQTLKMVITVVNK